MITPAIGIATKTYWSDIAIEGERWPAIAGTSAAPCQTRSPVNITIRTVTA